MMSRDRRRIAVLSATAIAASIQVGWGASSRTFEAPLVNAYGAECEGRKLGKTESEILEQLNALHRERGQADLVADSALTLAAAAHLSQFGHDARPQPFAEGVGSVRYWLDAAGVTTQFVRSACAKIEAGTDPKGIVDALAPRFDTAGMTHVGVACRRKGESIAVTAIAASHRLSLDSPIPLLNPGPTCRLVGRFRAPVQGYRVLVTRPNGTTVRAVAAEAPQMDVNVPIGRDAGAYVVEIVGVTDDGPLLTDVLKLYTGTPWPAPAGPLAATLESEAAALVSEINKQRAAQAMAPLKSEPQLTQIAQYNSKGLRKRQARDPDGKVAHVYIRSLVRYTTYRVDGVVGPRAPKANEVRGTLSSTFTHIGIGMARGTLDGKEAIWTTIVLMAK